MNDRPAQPRNTEELLERLRIARSALDAVLDPLTEEQMTGPRDNGDWTIKDHMLNVALWERSILNLLRGIPRYEALGIDEATYFELDEHGLNTIMVAEWRERPVREVRAIYRDTHQQMLHLLASLSWDALQLPYAHYLPDEPAAPGEDDTRPVLFWVIGNTADHYDQHRPWIEALVEASEG
jgi:hypothetical protein